MKKHPFLHVDYHSTVKIPPRDERRLKEWLSYASATLEFLFKKKIIPGKRIKEVQVSLLICGDARIRELNRQHRAKDKVTDVLSFPAHENLRSSVPPEENLFVGDLAICHPQTIRQARAFDITYLDEFIHLFFHGMIHLLGYDHERGQEEESLMEDWEQLALKKFSQLRKRS